MKDEHISVNDINPVDYYNQNCVELAVDMLIKKKGIKRIGVDAITFVQNKGDDKKRMLVIDKDTNFFISKLKNGFGVPVGHKITAFQLVQQFCFKNSWSATAHYVIYEVMFCPNDYIRVGTKYYKRIKKLDRYNVKRTFLKTWDRLTLVDDHGKDFLDKVQKFQDFTMVPDNKNYKRVIGSNYNLYNEFDHKARKKKDFKGVEDFEWTEKLLRHVFGDQYLQGLIYIKTLYDMPKQALPILVLISEERQTGKSTFIYWMSVLFGANTVVINPQDIGNSFNGAYAEKNIIMIEESHFENRQATEKLKNLATQKDILVNNKFVVQYSIPFFGKIIITSNDEQKFSKVDNPEIRYWVRKIPTLVGKANHQILDSLTVEIPTFLHYLENLKKYNKDCLGWLKNDGSVDVTKSRMVFTKDEIETDALTTVKKESRESLHKEIEMYLDNHAQQNKKIEEFMFTSLNIKEKFFSHNHRFGVSYINTVLKSQMKLYRTEKTKRFAPLEVEGFSDNKIVGKPFVYKNPYFGKSGYENNEEDEDEFPF